MKTNLELNNRQNNLNLLRFLAALLVIFSHAYVLTGQGEDPISQVTRGQTDGGRLAVMLFFFYGGLLVMKSMEGKRTARAFFYARMLRIFPALWIVVLATVSILGPALTTLPRSAYFQSGTTWKYLLNGLLLPVHPLPGVFEQNPAMSTVNGALWTLPVEFACYIMCFVCYRTGLTRGKRPLVLLPAAMAVTAVAWLHFSNSQVIRNAILPVLFFYIGMVCWRFHDRLTVNGWMALGAMILLALATAFGAFVWAVSFLYPCILLYLGFGTPHKLSQFGSKLELSYAIYLTAFPIQQMLIQLVPYMTPLVNFALAACLSTAAAIPITLLERRLVHALRR